MQAAAVLEWGLASTAIRRRPAFGPPGFGAPWLPAVLAAFLAVPRTLGRVTRAGAAPWEHLVQRGKDGVNAKQRGSQPLLLCLSYLQIE